MKVILEDVEVGTAVVIAVLEGASEFDDPDPGEEYEPEEEQSEDPLLYGKVVKL